MGIWVKTVNDDLTRKQQLNIFRTILVGTTPILFLNQNDILQANRDIVTMAVLMDKTKQKTIMDMTPQELLKSIVASVGELIKASNNTLKTTLSAEIKTSEAKLREEIKASEAKLEKIMTQLLKVTEENIRKDMAKTQDIDRLEQKLDRHEERIERLEDHTGIHKN